MQENFHQSEVTSIVNLSSSDNQIRDSSEIPPKTQTRRQHISQSKAITKDRLLLEPKSTIHSENILSSNMDTPIIDPRQVAHQNPILLVNEIRNYGLSLLTFSL